MRRRWYEIRLTQGKGLENEKKQKNGKIMISKRSLIGRRRFKNVFFLGGL